MTVTTGQDLRIREADPAEDREPILAVLSRNLPDAAAPERHARLYLSNPHGRALVWLAEDPSLGAVGTSAAYPRRMRVDGEACVALNLADFAIDSEFRSLGPALRLLRASLGPVRSGRFAFAYDHPSEPMLALHMRMGSTNLGRMRRFVRPLSATPLVRKRFGDGLASRVAGKAGDVALRARDVLARAPRGIRVEEHDGPFGEEFDALDSRLAGACRVRGERSSAYLEWRYGEGAIHPFESLQARRDGELAGFVVFRPSAPGRLLVTELESADDDTARALVVELVARARARGEESIEIIVLEKSPAARPLKDLGFVEREAGTAAVPFAPPGSGLADPLGDAANWWMVEGDRDA